MKKQGFFKRLLALLLTLCTLTGLLPIAAIPEAQAEESAKSETRAVTDEINTILNRLLTSYNNLKIPANKEVFNYTSLNGIFFIREGSSGRTINFANGTGNHKDRLTANSSSGTAAGTYNHLDSLPVTASNEGSFTKINGAEMTNLDYAVEIKTYTGNITWNTTNKYTDSSTNKTYTGWAGYIKWEYNRSNTWCGTGTTFGAYLGINGLPSTSDPKYSIKSLHPNRASAPYLATSNGSGSMKYSSTAFPWFLKVYSTNQSAKLYKIDPSGSDVHTYWLGIDTANSNYVSGHTMSQIVREDRNKRYADVEKFKNCYKRAFEFRYWDFFQVSPAPLELYRALLEAKKYVTGTNADKAFPDETYLGFLQYVESSMTLYNQKRTVWATETTNPDRVNMDNVAKDLRSYMAVLELEAEPEVYMDIPMEVLDFRADGFLFEHCGGPNPFSLNNSISAMSSNTVAPGSPGTGSNGGVYREGLIQSKLVNGNIVYRKETVQYIAEALFLQYCTLSDPRVTITKNNFDANWNNIFMQLVDPLGASGSKRGSQAALNSYPLGACGYDFEANYNATIAKTHNKSEGGNLRFDQVENCFDLAYYMLTNLWRETPKDDYVDTTRQLPYNLKIDELTTLRMLKDSQGYYVYSSDKENGRCLDSGVIFNHNLTNSAGSNLPTLNAAAELGFESPSMLGNDTTGAKETNSAIYSKRNYYVMYHMKSSFVYYENKNLEFEFTGDDDVYFFINDELICDIGGTHAACTREVQLNGEIAQRLGLKDGDICTFDMFLAERRTTEINLNLRTNIEMMPIGIATDKVQYEYTTAGVIGQEIPEGGVVTDNTEIGYGFKLLNRCDNGANALTFTDNNLGVELSETKVSLNGTADAEDLIVIYRTYDHQSNKIYAGEPVLQSYDTLTTLLTEAVADVNSIVPMKEGTYMLTGLTEEQLMHLMSIGLPASVQISIYGFHRTVSSAVGGYTNLVVTTCRPIAGKAADGSFLYDTILSGFATRKLNVQTTNKVTAEPLQIVIDYGKPVAFTVTDLLSCVTYDPMDVQISYTGMVTEGKHGDILFRKPAGLLLQTDGATLTKEDKGTYDRYGDTFRYIPQGMVEEIERIFALIRVDDMYLGGSWYLTVAIEIIPAAVMYYEAESLESVGQLQFTEKWTEEAPETTEPETEPTESETEPTESETEPTEPETETPDPEETPEKEDIVHTNTQITYVRDTADREHPVSIYAPTEDQNVLYFSFDDPSLNKDRYMNNPVYGGVNFDELSNWWFQNYVPSFSMIDGALQFTTQNDGSTWGYAATGARDESNKYNANNAAFPLRYIPSTDDWCEIRLKVDKAAAQDATGIHLRMELFSYYNDTSLAHAALTTKLFPEDALNNGWFYLKFPMTTQENREDPCGIPYSELTLVRRINFIIRGMDTSEAFTTAIDYIYIGPEETCPSNQKQDYLYFGFDNTDADRYRYTNPIYGFSHNFDKSPSYSGDNWLYSASSVGAANGAMTLSCSEGESLHTFSLQTGTASTINVLDYPTYNAETAWVKLKLSGLTSAIGNTEEMDETAQPMARLSFTLNGKDLTEVSTCHVDFPLSEEHFNNPNYMTLSADIQGILEDHEAQKITSLCLSVLNVASKEGETGSITIDEIYVGPTSLQDTDSYIAPSKTEIYTAPEKEVGSYTYDSSVLYFGFGGTSGDTDRFSVNPIYNGKNYNTNAQWTGTTGYSLNIADGAMNFSASSGSNSWTFFSTGTSSSDISSLSFKPSAGDWLEMRIKINDLNPLKDRTKIYFDVEMYRDATYKYKISCPAPTPVELKSGELRTDTYYTIRFVLPENSGGWANCVPFKDLGTVKRFVILPTGLKSNATFKCSVDYVYVGPKEKLPSQRSSDRLYIGFDNDAVAKQRYSSVLYGGDNFDTAARWRYATHRSTAPTISGGALSITLNQEAQPWIETARNGTNGGYYMHFDPSNAEIFQIRVKFNNLQIMNDGSSSLMTVMFGDGTQYNSALEPIQFRKEYPIEKADISTNGKWFTYKVKLDGLLTGVHRITGLRINFASLTYIDSTSTLSVDYIYVGPELTAPGAEYREDEDYTYGWDSSYTKDSLLSDNEALYLEGRGVPLGPQNSLPDYSQTPAYSEVAFSFTGTGFDLISRTGKQQGMLRMVLYKKVADTDGFKDVFVKSLSVNTKGELELNQIPVLSVQGLDHGTYSVKLWFSDKTEAPQIPGLDLSVLAHGNEFYIDAIRIYDPIDVDAKQLTADATLALQAYKRDKEAYSYIKEIRNILLSKENFESLVSSTEGAVFVDVERVPKNLSSEEGEGTVPQPGETEGPDHITTKVQTYNKIGPKNEVYLAPDQAIAFRLAVDTEQSIVSLDVGAKNILQNANTKLSVGFVSDAVELTSHFGITTATAQYYAINTDKIRYLTSDSAREVYLVIYNTSEDNENNVISITDIKVAYDVCPTFKPPADSPTDPEIKRSLWTEQAPVRFLADGNTATAVEALVKAMADSSVQKEAPIVAEEIQILHSLNLASDISINYVVPAKELDSFDNIRMILSLPVYEGDTYVGSQEQILYPESKGDYVYFTLTGLTAVNMNDTVEAYLSMTGEGQTYVTPVDAYSIAQYAYTQLHKPESSEKLKALCADLLRYGAQAQSYKDYRRNSLADSAMTEEIRAYLTDTQTVSFDNTNNTTENVAGATVPWVGKTLLLESKVSIRYVVDLSAYEEQLSEVSLHLRYQDTEGEEQTVILRQPAPYGEKEGQYSFDFSGLLAAELRQQISATVYVGSQPVSDTLNYSAATYGIGKTGTLGALCKCLLAYSDSAKAYFLN